MNACRVPQSGPWRSLDQVEFATRQVGPLVESKTAARRHSSTCRPPSMKPCSFVVTTPLRPSELTSKCLHESQGESFRHFILVKDNFSLAECRIKYWQSTIKARSQVPMLPTVLFTTSLRRIREVARSICESAAHSQLERLNDPSFSDVVVRGVAVTVVTRADSSGRIVGRMSLWRPNDRDRCCGAGARSEVCIHV